MYFTVDSFYRDRFDSTSFLWRSLIPLNSISYVICYVVLLVKEDISDTGQGWKCYRTCRWNTWTGC